MTGPQTGLSRKKKTLLISAGVLLLLIAAAVAVVIVAVVAATMLSGKRPGQKIQQSYEKTYSAQPGEWSKYYNKK